MYVSLFLLARRLSDKQIIKSAWVSTISLPRAPAKPLLAVYDVIDLYGTPQNVTLKLTIFASGPTTVETISEIPML